MQKSPERPNEGRKASKELVKVCWNTTVEKLVFSKNRYDTHLLPIFPSIDNKRIKCFHATGPWNFQSLIGLQRSKKAISAATKISSNFIKGGVSGSGIVAVVSGNFLLGGFSDLGTIPDQNGQRWVPAENLGRAGLKEKVEKIQQELLKKNGILDTKFKEVPEKVKQDLKRKITSDYIECTRTLWKEVKEHASKEEEESKRLEYDKQINEVVVDRVVIEYVLITNDKERVVKPMCEKNGIRYLYLNRKKALRWLEVFIEKNRAS